VRNPALRMIHLSYKDVCFVVASIIVSFIHLIFSMLFWVERGGAWANWVGSCTSAWPRLWMRATVHRPHFHPDQPQGLAHWRHLGKLRNEYAKLWKVGCQIDLDLLNNFVLLNEWERHWICKSETTVVIIQLCNLKKQQQQQNPSLADYTTQWGSKHGKVI
jgi:hypothetical protein